MEVIDPFAVCGNSKGDRTDRVKALTDVATLSNADVVFEHSDKRRYLLMLKNKKSGHFAVCSIDPSRDILTAPNYRATTEQKARLYAMLSKQGLSSLLDWTDRPTAVRRYADLVEEIDDSGSVVSLLA
jgi:hypothetical protein